MNERELAAWLAAHDGEVARHDNERVIPAKSSDNPYAPDNPDAGKKVVDSTTIVAQDGATITVRRDAPSGDNPEGGVGPTITPYHVIGTTPPRQKSQQTPEQQRKTQLDLEQAEQKRVEEVELNNQRSYNHARTGLLETHAERAVREYKELQAKREKDERDKKEADAKLETAKQQEAANRIAQGGLEVSQGHLAIAQANAERDARKPQFLSTADDKNKNLIRYNPETGQVESMPNPNYDEVKEKAEQLRQQLATQIQARQVTLEEAKMQYQQWFDTNVKTPLALAQEARDKAAEQRAALDAEERRRQFAANFSLQKGELGQRAGAAAMQAEQSLLPYRAGPTESAEMSSAINSLAAGGSMSTNASAGIHFTPGAFEFDAPDFKGIAKQAAKDALKGISSYIPSDQEYSTADYSNVPAPSTSGAPSIPQGYGDFQGIIDNLKSTYNFGG